MKSKEKRKYKRWRWLRVALEISFMVAGILCSIMPYPYPLLVPIGIGTIRIISSAVAREKKTEEPPAIVYCNGEKPPEEKSVKPAKMRHSTGAMTKNTPQVTANIKKPVKAAETAHITGATRKKGVKTV